ncbi:nucleoside diphosphate kinase homolog 7 [Megachile rotundata]|uniref:nucleoside diphosphate kinase homolog 7 n=1 Tax=Megachile rotundata TaxID=143995 RepID=UPI003FD2BE12
MQIALHGQNCKLKYKMQRFHVNPFDAEDFLEVYNGVLPDYEAIEELQSGSCIVMEIKHQNEKFGTSFTIRNVKQLPLFFS